MAFTLLSEGALPEDGLSKQHFQKQRCKKTVRRIYHKKRNQAISIKGIRED